MDQKNKYFFPNAPICPLCEESMCWNGLFWVCLMWEEFHAAWLIKRKKAAQDYLNRTGKLFWNSSSGNTIWRQDMVGALLAEATTMTFLFEKNEDIVVIHWRALLVEEYNSEKQVVRFAIIRDGLGFNDVYASENIQPPKIWEWEWSPWLDTTKLPIY